jgi:DNA polymerase (family 10)
MKVKKESISNKDIARAFRLTASLLELHDENPFKARSLQNAAFKVERLPSSLSGMSEDEITALDGIGKSIQGKIKEFLNHGSFDELDDLLKLTPDGVVEMLGIKGIGPKKVRVLWKDLGVESPGELLYACHENRLLELKGFGSKTQESIRKAIEYSMSNEGKFLYAVVEAIAARLLREIQEKGLAEKISFTGALRRKCEVLQSLDLALETDDLPKLTGFLKKHDLFENSEVSLSDGCVKATLAGTLSLNIYSSKEESFFSLLFRTTGSETHLKKLKEDYGWKEDMHSASEEEIYARVGLPYIEPELREDFIEFSFAKKKKMPLLLQEEDLKGILHNHSTYSDGEHSLKEMAMYCKELGFQYFGICDHSKSAFYANGMQPERILEQHVEIDRLNQEMAPFRIFKGIESDILTDGSLDYPDEILQSFDFIVASIHSNLRMDKEKATRRLIRAIENPFTTILGHPSGRLLLAREAYPLDYKKIIDACAANGVVIELNANPYRLDIDWHYVPYALEKEVMISINPDAHRKEGFGDMHYGVCAARKGGLIKEMTFNALDLTQVSRYFQTRKK